MEETQNKVQQWTYTIRVTERVQMMPIYDGAYI